MVLDPDYLIGVRFARTRQRDPIRELRRIALSGGFTFRYYDDLKGQGWRYLNVGPSEKALKKEREKLHEMTNHRQCCKPIPELIEGLNRHLKGWKNYFDFGYPRQAFREINTYARDRLTQHLRRGSQRPFRPPEGVSFNEQIQRLGLVNL